MRYVYFFSGFNKEENFRILIAAASEDEAFDFAEKYRKDAGIKGKFCIEEVPGYIEDIRFDCDYLITEYLEDIISTSEAAAAQGFFPEEMFREFPKNWALSEYNEGTEEQLDYYILESRANAGDTAYLYNHYEREWEKMQIVHVTRKSDSPARYEDLLKNEDVLVDGESEYEADTSAEFITDNDCYLVWFKYCEDETSREENISI